MCVVLKGLDDEWQEEGLMLGQFTYDEDGDALQTFSVTVSITQTQSLIMISSCVICAAGCCLSCVLNVRCSSGGGHERFSGDRSAGAV